jgi:hypothetical protein
MQQTNSLRQMHNNRPFTTNFVWQEKPHQQAQCNPTGIEGTILYYTQIISKNFWEALELDILEEGPVTARITLVLLRAAENWSLEALIRKDTLEDEFPLCTVPLSLL